MKRYIALFLMLFMACCCFGAESPEELLYKYSCNISIPDKNIETFHFQLSINIEESVYLVQVWYKNDGHFGFNLYDKDKTPLLVIRNDKAILYNVLDKQIMCCSNIISIVNIGLQDGQLIANINYHQPNEECKENTIKLGALDLAKHAVNNMTANEKDGLLEITGYTEQGNAEITTVDTKASLPLKSLKIDMDDTIVVFDDVAANAKFTGNEDCFNLPIDALNKSGLKIVELNSDNLLDAMQLMQYLMQGCVVRAAIYDESMRADLEKGYNTKYDWASLKAADMMNSAKLRQIFPQK